jgi:hypothetical protein
MRWELLGVSAVNILAILGQTRYLKLVSTKPEPNEQRDTLLTN